MMSDKNEILKSYLTQHDALGTRKDARDKEQFDIDHRAVWAACDAELRTRKVELQEKPSPTQAEAAELAELTQQFPEPSASGGPPRDLAAEIDALGARITALEGK